MSEEEWLAAAHPDALLAYLHEKAIARKLRLFACACCRRIEHLLSFSEFIRAIEVSEQFADGQASDEERQRAYKVVEDYVWSHPPEHSRFRYSDFAVIDAAGNWPVHICHPIESARRAAKSAREAMKRDPAYPTFLPAPELRITTIPVPSAELADYLRRSEKWKEAEDAVDAQFNAYGAAFQAAVLRDIFGNPFRPATVDPAWLTSDVVALAEGIYADRAFDRMPILADALQDAGCENEDILSHCRDASATHVRGCWVIDLLLGKK